MSDSSAVFDADAFATEWPELRIGGTVYRGRILSIIEWSAFYERFRKLGVDATDEASEPPAEQLAALQATFLDYLRAVFPPVATSRTVALPGRWNRLARRKTVLSETTDPIAAIEAMGFRAILETFRSFFALQSHATIGARPGTPPDPATLAVSTAGTNSLLSTTAAPSGGASS